MPINFRNFFKRRCSVSVKTLPCQQATVANRLSSLTSIFDRSVNLFCVVISTGPPGSYEWGGGGLPSLRKKREVPRLRQRMCGALPPGPILCDAWQRRMSDVSPTDIHFCLEKCLRTRSRWRAVRLVQRYMTANSLPRNRSI